MAILDGGDQDLLRLWNLVAELSEEINRNRTLAVSLYTQASNVKNQAIHSQTGFVLRRFNLDQPRETYESELEQMNVAMGAENQSLQHDNKQLNTLIKEYEQTLDTLMSAFRTKARDVQEHELSLVRDYEAKLLVREEEAVKQDLATSTAVSQSLARLSHSLRHSLRSLGGEDADSDEEPSEGAIWALEREAELARLEKENEMLRRMLGVPVPSEDGDPHGSDMEPRPLFGGQPEQGQHSWIGGGGGGGRVVRRMRAGG